jgi:hypothetical protein
MRQEFYIGELKKNSSQRSFLGFKEVKVSDLCISIETCQKYSVTVILYYIFHIKPQFFKTLFQSQFLFDFDEMFTNRSENVRSFL